MPIIELDGRRVGFFQSSKMVFVDKCFDAWRAFNVQRLFCILQNPNLPFQDFWAYTTITFHLFYEFV